MTMAQRVAVAQLNTVEHDAVSAMTVRHIAVTKINNCGQPLGAESVRKSEEKKWITVLIYNAK